MAIARNIRNSMEVPYRDQMSEAGFVSKPWAGFFRAIYERLNPLGIEQSCNLTSDLTDVFDVPGMKFNSDTENFAIVDYLIQRVSSGEEKIESGSLYIHYRPKANNWTIAKSVSSGNASVTFTVNSSGQVRYQAQPTSGAQYYDKLTWRSRTLNAKITRVLW